MWVKNYSKFYADVSPELIWNILSDVDNWASWHDDLDYCKLEGDFKVGSHFMLKPKGMSAVKIMLVEMDEGKSFTDCTTFWGAKMFDTHKIEVKDGGIVISHETKVTGPLRWLWVKLVAQNVFDFIPKEIDALINLARKG